LLLTLLELVTDIGDPVVGDLGDVDSPVHTRHHFDKRAEVGDPLHAIWWPVHDGSTAPSWRMLRENWGPVYFGSTEPTGCAISSTDLNLKTPRG
jgi:hypothetical protein